MNTVSKRAAHDLVEELIELIGIYGLPEVMQTIADACDVEADVAKMSEEDATALNGIGLQVRELAAEVEAIIGRRS